MEGRGVKIERIANSKLREAVFRRRKNGLLRRAMELSVLADCDVAVLIFHGTTGKLTQYSSAPMGGLLQRFAHVCGRPHETYTNEDLYSHHVLARLASDAEEAAGAGTQRTRTLPSFWAAKAALEHQRQRGPRRSTGGGAGEQADGEEGKEGETGPRRKRARTAADGGEEGAADGMEVDPSEAEEESLSSFSELNRHAATLAQLADESGAQLTPRSRAAYGRIQREFDVLIARVREEMETAEALAAAADEPEGAEEEAGAAQEGSDEKPELSFGPPLQQQQQQPAPGLERQQSVVASEVAGAAAAGGAQDSAAARLKAPASPPAVCSPSRPQKQAQPASSITFAQQPHQGAASSVAGQASIASGRLAAGGTTPAAPASQLQLVQTTPVAAALALPPAGSAAAPLSQLSPLLPAQPGILPPGARIQLQALPTGSGFVLRPVAILSGAAAAPGAAAASAAAGQAAPGVMLQLQPAAAQAKKTAQGRGPPAQMPPLQLEQFLKLQQQHLVALAAVQQQAARLQAQQAQQQAQQAQQQMQQPAAQQAQQQLQQPAAQQAQQQLQQPAAQQAQQQLQQPAAQQAQQQLQQPAAPGGASAAAAAGAAAQQAVPQALQVPVLRVVSQTLPPAPQQQDLLPLQQQVQQQVQQPGPGPSPQANVAANTM